MRADDATPKKTPDENDGDSRKTKIGYSLRGQPSDELNLMMPMIVLLNTMLINGYQSC